MAADNYSFKLKNDLSELKALCRHVAYFGQGCGLPEPYISEMNICLDELFTNIVLYGFKDNREHFISFSMVLNGNTLLLSIEDDGIPFNPLMKEKSDLPADIDNAKIGGLGIHIVKKLMDDFRYERKRGKNKLTLKKYILAANNHLYKSNTTGNIPSNYAV